MTVVVFSGPTITHSEVRDILPNARCLPPAAMGDVCRLVKDGTEIVVLLDGVFERIPAISHTELLFALSKGIRIIGASMGAPRAAELSALGMEGIGIIFEMYCDGILEDDDEIALTHATEEHDYRPLSDPLVNIRYGLELARASGAILESSKDAILHHAKSQFYPERSWETLVTPGVVAGVSDHECAALGDLVRSSKPDLMRLDALDALHQVARDVADDSKRRSSGKRRARRLAPSSPS
jgi:hypothetical protein